MVLLCREAKQDRQTFVDCIYEFGRRGVGILRISGLPVDTFDCINEDDTRYL